ncbi:MAG TPA: hypothetical protein VHV55_22515 [Pirellulales bacterium]|jgi:hypothetical protein|nr:hypothetical protein [Pirellulales bacterium]
MSISFLCPSCGHRLKAREETSGKRAKCKCGQAVIVPLGSDGKHPAAGKQPVSDKQPAEHRPAAMGGVINEDEILDMPGPAPKRQPAAAGPRAPAGATAANFALVDERDALEHQPAQDITARYERVGGWLLLFSLGLTVVSPIGTLLWLAGAYKLFAEYPALLVVLAADGVIKLGLTAFGIFAGLGLLLKRPKRSLQGQRIFVMLSGVPICFRNSRDSGGKWFTG